MANSIGISAMSAETKAGRTQIRKNIRYVTLNFNCSKTVNKTHTHKKRMDTKYATFNIFSFEYFFENLMFLRFIILEIFTIISIQHLKFPVISIKNLVKLIYILLLIKKWNLHEIFTSYLLSQEKTTDVNFWLMAS